MLFFVKSVGHLQTSAQTLGVTRLVGTYLAKFKDLWLFLCYGPLLIPSHVDIEAADRKEGTGSV